MKKRSRTGTRYCGTDDIEVIESSGSIVVERPIYVLGSGIIIIITMRRLTRHVSVIRMTNRRRDIRGVQNEKGRCPGGGKFSGGVSVFLDGRAKLDVSQNTSV